MSYTQPEREEALASAENVLFDYFRTLLPDQDSKRGVVGIPPTRFLDLAGTNEQFHWYFALNGPGDPTLLRRQPQEHCIYQMDGMWVGRYRTRVEGQRAAFCILNGLPIQPGSTLHGINNVSPEAMPSVEPVSIPVLLRGVSNETTDEDEVRTGGEVLCHQATLLMRVTFLPARLKV